MSRPVIGIIPLWDESKDSIWMIPGYLRMIEQAGGVGLVLPLTSDNEVVNQLCDTIDGVLFTGGHDVNPTLYNQIKSEKCGAPCTERDDMERMVFDYFLEHDKPLLGICRGIQLLNVFCGGTLYQDLPTEFGTEINHQMTAPYDRVFHDVTVVDDTPLAHLLGVKSLGVNSYHHQAIKTLAPTLKSMAHSDDGLIEAVYMPCKRYVRAVQWHPELNFESSESSRIIIADFVSSC